MKNFYIIFCMVLMLPALTLRAQKPITIMEDSLLVGKYMHPGISVTIPEVNYEKTLKNWIKQIEAGTKSKVVTEDGMMTLFGAMLKKISPNPVNMYSKLVNQDTLNKLLVCIEIKKDEYLEPALGDAQMMVAKDYLKAFAKDQYIEFIKDEVAAEEKKLKDLTGQLSSLENDYSKTQKKAESSRTTISKEQETLATMNGQLSQLSTDINRENSVMIGMDTGPEKEAQAARIKEMNKTKKKLQKDISKAESNIKEAESSIAQADDAIPLNKNEQAVMQQKIDEQTVVVQKFNDKLNTVKLY
jgi:predicted  nucleic acid-binding Zn-ribbon protein